MSLPKKTFAAIKQLHPVTLVTLGAAAYFEFQLISEAIHYHFAAIDSLAVVHGTEFGLQCLAAGRWFCGYNVGYFPLFQYLIAGPLLHLGWSEHAVLVLFACLTMICFNASFI